MSSGTRPQIMTDRMMRALTLMEACIEDLNSADLDIGIHEPMTKLHAAVLDKYHEIKEKKKLAVDKGKWVWAVIDVVDEEGWSPNPDPHGTGTYTRIYIPEDQL